MMGKVLYIGQAPHLQNRTALWLGRSVATPEGWMVSVQFDDTELGEAYRWTWLSPHDYVFIG